MIGAYLAQVKPTRRARRGRLRAAQARGHLPDVSERTWNNQDQRRYLVNVALSARSALVEWEWLARIGGQRPPHPGEWPAVQNFLGRSADVAKWLAPSRDSRSDRSPRDRAFRKLRGEMLRELLNINSASAILDRSMRNIAEHLDEYYDRWNIEQPYWPVEEFDNYDLGQWKLPPIQQIDMTTGVLTLGHASISLADLVADLRHILQRASEIEPLAKTDGHPGLAYVLSSMPMYPPEMGLAAPTRFPAEPVTTGSTDIGFPGLDEIVRQAAAILGYPDNKNQVEAADDPRGAEEGIG